MPVRRSNHSAWFLTMLLAGITVLTSVYRSLGNHYTLDQDRTRVLKLQAEDTIPESNIVIQNQNLTLQGPPNSKADLSNPSSDKLIQNQSLTLQGPPSSTQKSIKKQNPLNDILLQMPDTVFVVYGNKGYASLLKNFICNMALFPPMLSHTLMIVTDEETSRELKSFNKEIRVYTANHHLQEAYDFETRGYLNLMLERGLTLVELLKLAIVQSKIVIWLEPDFHYTQNLLNRPEITETTSDLVLYWDHAAYCGCFIRFAPVPASLGFYKAVMDRMAKIHAENEATLTNDQILLNEVVADQLPNFTIFDKCLYRSGQYNTGGYMLEYQRACDGIHPVAQHHNWIIGVEKKVSMAKETEGWFLTDDTNNCKKRDILLSVMTMNRPRSLERLIHSLDTAVYPTGSLVDLRVSIDRNFNGIVDTETKHFLSSLEWTHGIFDVKIWPKKVGLFGQWIESWPAEQYPEDMYKAVILLEDDLQVSPFYAKWFVGAHEAYGNVSGVGAITGQRPNLVAAINGPSSVASQVPKGVKAFGYMLMATWSLSPKHSVWVDFRQWVAEKRSKDLEFIPNVPGILPNQWYEQFRSRGEEENMWEMWFIRFTFEKKLYTVYPWIQGGEKTVVGNWMEAGLHFSGAPALDFPISDVWDAGVLTQDPLPLVGYDLNFDGT
jgi:hypothetical protein